jgi:hypothetical protein
VEKVVSCDCRFRSGASALHRVSPHPAPKVATTEKYPIVAQVKHKAVISLEAIGRLDSKKRTVTQTEAIYCLPKVLVETQKMQNCSA